MHRLQRRAHHQIPASAQVISVAERGDQPIGNCRRRCRRGLDRSGQEKDQDRLSYPDARGGPWRDEADAP